MLGGGQVSRFASALPRSFPQACATTSSIETSTRSFRRDVCRRLGRAAGRVAGVRRDARPRLRLRADGDRLSSRGKPLARSHAQRRRSRPIAAGNRPACGSKRASRIASPRPAATKSPRRRRETVAVRAGRRHDRIPRRPAARHAARRDRRHERKATRRSPTRFDIGLGTTIKPAASGTLYLRVNDSPADSTTIAAR